MAKLRKGVSYRALERPYTRVSKYRELNYVRANPPTKIAQFNMGNRLKDFSHRVVLVSRSGIQLRNVALESARQACNRVLEKGIGKEAFFLQLKPYPHHILRENPLAAGAGADRMSTGMAHSFGKPIGKAAQVKPGTEIMVVRVDERNIRVAKRALKLASHKLPNSYSILAN